MGCGISSNNERVYVGLEASYGVVPAVTAQNRIPLLKLSAKQVPAQTARKDKTGSRSFAGLPNRIRKTTTFGVNTLMTQWSDQTMAPAQGPLFQAAMGGTPLSFAGGTVAAMTGTTSIQFAAAHGLRVGQAITFSGEMRFVASVTDAMTVVINAPFTNIPVAGSAIGGTMTYLLGGSLSGVSVFDYWDPAGAVQRIVEGAAIDTMKIKVNGDFQEFDFAGPARDVIDNVSFAAGEGGLAAFPAEPALGQFDYTLVPGHLGEVWMGTSPNEFLTLTAAELTLENGVDLRAREFGSDYARCIAAGQRSVKLNFELFEMADGQTAGLYQAARQRSPISVMLQLGEQANQLFGAYMPAMVPEVPEWDDSETRLQWKFQNSRAQGTADNELYVAFG
jgi:hypothetical protein